MAHPAGTVAQALANADAREVVRASRRASSRPPTPSGALQRNVHDGAQQRPVALVVQLRLIRKATDSDLPGARSGLDSVTTELREALDELRELARDIHPPC